MFKPIPKRRMIALAAAYLVALQALLLPLSVAAGSPFMAPPCASSASQPASQPANHDTGCPCAAGCGMQCCAQALVAPVPVVAERIPVIVYTAAPLRAFVAVAHAPDRSPLNPRAPPFA
jgi:hypothetical protein